MSESELERISKNLELLQDSHNKLQEDFNTLLESLGKISKKQRITKPVVNRDKVSLDLVDGIEVNQFWEVVNKIGLDKLNHSNDEQLIALNLTEVYNMADKNNYILESKNQMVKFLKKSRQYQFKQDNRVISSKRTGKSIRCWIFKNKKQKVTG